MLNMGDTILHIGQQVRESLIQQEGDVTGFCLEACQEIQKLLLAKNIPSTIVKGFISVDFPLFSDDDDEIYDPLHFWLEIGDSILDVTATQFLDYLEEECYIEDVVFLESKLAFLHHS